MCQVIRHSCCSKSSFSEQVDRLLSVCNQRLYLLSQLRKQGLADKCSGIVYGALVLGKVLYALSGWGGYVSQTQKDRIDASFRKVCKWRLTSKLYNFDELPFEVDRKLFAHSVRGPKSLILLLYLRIPSLHIITLASISYGQVAVSIFIAPNLYNNAFILTFALAILTVNV